MNKKKEIGNLVIENNKQIEKRKRKLINKKRKQINMRKK